MQEWCKCNWVSEAICLNLVWFCRVSNQFGKEICALTCSYQEAQTYCDWIRAINATKGKCYDKHTVRVNKGVKPLGKLTWTGSSRQALYYQGSVYTEILFAACHNLILSSKVKGKFSSNLTQASHVLDSNNAPRQQIISFVIFSS